MNGQQPRIIDSDRSTASLTHSSFLVGEPPLPSLPYSLETGTSGAEIIVFQSRGTRSASEKISIEPRPKVNVAMVQLIEKWLDDDKGVHDPNFAHDYHDLEVNKLRLRMKF